MGRYYDTRKFGTICLKTKGICEYLEGTVHPQLPLDPVLSALGFLPGLLVYPFTYHEPPSLIEYKVTLAVHDSDNFKKLSPTVVINNKYIGQTVDEPYQAGDRAFFRTLLTGDVVYVRSYEPVAPGDILVPAGDFLYEGYVYPSVNPPENTESALFKALEPSQATELVAAEVM